MSYFYSVFAIVGMLIFIVLMVRQLIFSLRSTDKREKKTHMSKAYSLLIMSVLALLVGKFLWPSGDTVKTEPTMVDPKQAILQK